MLTKENQTGKSQSKGLFRGRFGRNLNTLTAALLLPSSTFAETLQIRSLSRDKGGTLTLFCRDYLNGNAHRILFSEGNLGDWAALDELVFFDSSGRCELLGFEDSSKAFFRIAEVPIPQLENPLATNQTAEMSEFMGLFSSALTAEEKLNLINGEFSFTEDSNFVLTTAEKEAQIESQIAALPAQKERAKEVEIQNLEIQNRMVFERARGLVAQSLGIPVDDVIRTEWDSEYNALIDGQIAALTNFEGFARPRTDAEWDRLYRDKEESFRDELAQYARNKAIHDFKVGISSEHGELDLETSLEELFPSREVETISPEELAILLSQLDTFFGERECYVRDDLQSKREELLARESSIGPEDILPSTTQFLRDHDELYRIFLSKGQEKFREEYVTHQFSDEYKVWSYGWFVQIATTRESDIKLLSDELADLEENGPQVEDSESFAELVQYPHQVVSQLKLRLQNDLDIVAAETAQKWVALNSQQIPYGLRREEWDEEKAKRLEQFHREQNSENRILRAIYGPAIVILEEHQSTVDNVINGFNAWAARSRRAYKQARLFAPSRDAFIDFWQITDSLAINGASEFSLIRDFLATTDIVLKRIEELSQDESPWDGRIAELSEERDKLAYLRTWEDHYYKDLVGEGAITSGARAFRQKENFHREQSRQLAQATNTFDNILGEKWRSVLQSRPSTIEPTLVTEITRLVEHYHRERKLVYEGIEQHTYFTANPLVVLNDKQHLSEKTAVLLEARSQFLDTRRQAKEELLAYLAQGNQMILSAIDWLQTNPDQRPPLSLTELSSAQEIFDTQRDELDLALLEANALAITSESVSKKDVYGAPQETLDSLLGTLNYFASPAGRQTTDQLYEEQAAAFQELRFGDDPRFYDPETGELISGYRIARAVAGFYEDIPPPLSPNSDFSRLKVEDLPYVYEEVQLATTDEKVAVYSSVLDLGLPEFDSEALYEWFLGNLVNLDRVKSSALLAQHPAKLQEILKGADYRWYPDGYRAKAGTIPFGYWKAWEDAYDHVGEHDAEVEFLFSYLQEVLGKSPLRAISIVGWHYWSESFSIATDEAKKTYSKAYEAFQTDTLEVLEKLDLERHRFLRGEIGLDEFILIQTAAGASIFTNATGVVLDPANITGEVADTAVTETIELIASTDSGRSALEYFELNAEQLLSDWSSFELAHPRVARQIMAAAAIAATLSNRTSRGGKNENIDDILRGFSKKGGDELNKRSWLEYWDNRSRDGEYGHFFSDHVGKNKGDLLVRLANDPNLQKVSTFNDTKIAENIVGNVIRKNRDGIEKYVKSGNHDDALVLDYKGDGEAIGFYLKRGHSEIIEASDARIIIRVDDNGKYFILTGVVLNF